MADTTRKKILNHQQIQAKMERIAHQIHENYFQEKELILVGIAGRGYDVAKRLHKLLQEIAEVPLVLDKIELDKDKPLQHDMALAGNTKLKNKAVLLVDDVLNSGKTLAYAAGHLLQQEPKILKTVILVNREHRKYPITADFVGLSLATTMKEHIAVELGRSNGVYLNDV